MMKNSIIDDNFDRYKKYIKVMYLPSGKSPSGFKIKYLTKANTRAADLHTMA